MEARPVGAEFGICRLHGFLKGSDVAATQGPVRTRAGTGQPSLVAVKPTATLNPAGDTFRAHAPKFHAAAVVEARSVDRPVESLAHRLSSGATRPTHATRPAGTARTAITARATSAAQSAFTAIATFAARTAIAAIAARDATAPAGRCESPLPARATVAVGTRSRVPGITSHQGDDHHQHTRNPRDRQTHAKLPGARVETVAP
jgi:hypothetical protein